MSVFRALLSIYDGVVGENNYFCKNALSYVLDSPLNPFLDLLWNLDMDFLFSS